MFGDVLKANLGKLKDGSTNKKAKNAFWIILRNIAHEEILQFYPKKIDSNIAIECYYNILSQNLDKIPKYFQETLKSNNQERFRVINRNLWVTNAFHPDGLANMPHIIAEKKLNRNRRGCKITYVGEKINDN